MFLGVYNCRRVKKNGNLAYAIGVFEYNANDDAIRIEITTK